MRTFLLILLLVALAVVSGLSFVVAARAKGALALERECAPAALPRDVDTVVTCRFTVRNDGDAVTQDVRLNFEAAPRLRIPDRYRFFSMRRDGVDVPVGPSDLSYEFGDIAPGGQSVIELRIVIRDSQGFGARAVLTAGPEQERLVEQTFASEVTDSLDTPLAVRLRRSPDVPASLMLDISSQGADTVEVDKVEVAAGDRITMSPAPVGWTRDAASGLYVARLDGPVPGVPGLPVVPDMTVTISMTFSSDLDCAWAAPVVVVTGTRDGESVSGAVIEDEGIQLDECDFNGGQGGGGEVSITGLPAGGAGPNRDARAAPALAALAVLGLLITHHGVRLRRRAA
jgi:hypothetical protein